MGNCQVNTISIHPRRVYRLLAGLAPVIAAKLAVLLDDSVAGIIKATGLAPTASPTARAALGCRRRSPPGRSSPPWRAGSRAAPARRRSGSWCRFHVQRDGAIRRLAAIEHGVDDPGCVMALLAALPQASAGRGRPGACGAWSSRNESCTPRGVRATNAWPKGCRAPRDRSPARPRVACTRPASPPRAARSDRRAANRCSGPGYRPPQQRARFLQQRLGPLQGQYLQIAFGRHPGPAAEQPLEVKGLK